MEEKTAELMDEFEDEVSVDPYDDDEEWNNVTWGKDDEDESIEPEDKSQDNPETESEDEEDQPESKDDENDDAEPEAEPDAEAENADQWIELKHMDDEPRKVSKEEAKALAQKGLDYDRIRQERDSLKSNLPRYEAMEEFLKEMQGDFDSIEDFMDDTRARIMSDAEGISYNDALEKVKTKHKPEPAKDTDNGLDVDAFVTAYPDVKAEDIPASVWARVRQTGDLVGAYKEYDEEKKSDRIAELEREVETLKNNNKNKNRSTGSSKSSGASGNKSLIASMWDDDD